MNVFPFLSHKGVSLLLNASHPGKLALTNDANKAEFANFQTKNFQFSKVPKESVNQQDTGKVSNFEQ